VESEHSNGFHAPQEATRILGEAIDFARQGQTTLRPLRRAAGGPAPVTLEALVQNRHLFLRFLEKRVGDRATAEDILQEGFGRAAARIEDLREGDSVTAWFFRILRNAVVDHYRRHAASQRALEAFGRELEKAQPGTDVHDAVCQCVTRLAATLKPEYAEALARIEIEGVSVAAFAAEQGITANNAAVRVFRARQALRKQVLQSCGACAAAGCGDCHCRSS